MPRIKRYWPCSHAFNRDPEIQELRRKYADWMGYVWQEMCAIGDLNDGEVKGSPEQIGVSLAYISLTKRPSLSAKCITNALGFMEVCGWIEIQTDRVLIVKHAKYHGWEYKVKVPPNDPNDPNERSDPKNQEPATPEPSAEPAKAGKKELDPRIKKAADKVYLTDTVKYRRLIVWIKEAEKCGYTPAVIVASLERFLPHAAEVQNWYPYLDKIIEKTAKDMNAAQHDAEHERLKEETRELSKVISLRGLVKDA